MKKNLRLIGFALLCLLSFNSSFAQDSTKTASKETEKKSSAATIIKDFSYSYGYSFSQDLKENSKFHPNEMSAKDVLKGIKDGLKPDSAKLEEINVAMQERIAKDSVEVSVEEGKVIAYKLGYNAMGNMMSMLELPASDFHYGCIKKGFTDYTKGKTSKFSEEDMEKKLTSYFEEKQRILQEKAIAKREEEAKKNLEIGKKFLDENAKKEGIKVTESGLQYQVIKEGTGKKPTLESTVITHYTGTFMNGKVFDSSIERGQPTTFPLNAVIQGWQEGIQLMPIGSRFRFFIPSELAYGENSPPSIPPNSVLIFDVELLDARKEDLSSKNSKLGYSYGYMVGQSLARVEFSDAEKDPSQFIQGFANGFEGTKEDAMTIDMLLKVRMESAKAAQSPEAAQKIAYGIGYSSSYGLAAQLKAPAQDFDIISVGNGYTDAIGGTPSKVSDEEMSSTLRDYFEPLQQKMQADKTAQDEANAQKYIAEGAKFMEENAKKEGVQTMSNGMQYIVLKEGDGEQPTAESTVKTHYHGMLIDGTVFDSSVDRGEPVIFPLRNVIQGWQDAIPMMKVGSKYKLFIPPHLAYGNRAMGDKIPAGSTLIFEVELLGIE